MAVCGWTSWAKCSTAHHAAGGAGKAADDLFRIAKLAPGGAKEIIQNILKQMGSEGSQEVISELAGNLADSAIMGDNSAYERYVQSLMAQGADEKTARAAATKQFYVDNVAKAGLGGALSGGVMAGGASAVGAARSAGSANTETGSVNEPNFGQKNTASTNTDGMKPQYTFLSDKNEQEQKLADVYDNVVASHKGVTIQAETLEKYRAINNNPALKLISAIKEYYDETLNGTSVDVSMNGGVVEVKFENDGKHKSVGWRMKPEKAATFESLRQMFQQAEYAYSEENRDANEISSIPQFDYFITNANIEGADIPVKLQVRNLVKDGGNFEKRYYTHNLQNYKKRGSDSPVADTNGIGIDSNAYASSSTPNVAQAASEVNTQDMQNGGKDAAALSGNAAAPGMVSPLPAVRGTMKQAPTGRMPPLPAVGQKNTASAAAGTLPKMRMEDFTDAESSVWNNVEYDDTETRAGLQGRAHQEMVNAGQVVHIPESTIEQTGASFPDLRTVKKAERIPMLKQKMNELKNAMRGFLVQLKGGSYDFEVNGNILEARLYDTGIKEVMEKVTQDKASVLYHSEELFQNARYLYSTPDYDGNPNIYRWNYFYTPVEIGGETVGVRIAIRDMVYSKTGAMDSQIYNWGIKKGTTLDGEGRGQSRGSPGVSSVVPSGTPLDGGRPSTKPPSSDVSSGVPSDITLPQGQSGVNTEDMQKSGKDAGGWNRETLPGKAGQYLTRAESQALGKLGEAFSVPKAASREFLRPMMAELTREYMEQGSISRETEGRIFDAAYDSGIMVEDDYYNTYKDLKEELRTMPVTLSATDKADIVDYNDFRRKSMGKVRIVNDGGLPVDVRYQELAEKHPQLFPAQLTHPADQLRKMVEVAESIHKTERELAAYYGADAESFRKFAKDGFRQALDEYVPELERVKRYSAERAAA